MQISFRRSSGRGEYEVVGAFDDRPASSLEGWTFDLLWPDGVTRETGLGLEPATSGKPRLRSLASQPFQIGRTASSILLLPDARRSFEHAQTGLPVARQKSYVITALGFGLASQFDETSETVVVSPSFVTLENKTDVADESVDRRWERISAVLAQAHRLALDTQIYLQRYQDFLETGSPADSRLLQIGTNLRDSVSRNVEWYDPETDVLPALEAVLQITPPVGPSLPPPNVLDDSDAALRVRSAHEYRLARTRGAAGRRFSRTVLAAYRYTCIICGNQLGGFSEFSSGVDAAHILAWSDYDLDLTANGLALCKMHHWAFDSGLLSIRYDSETLVASLSPLARTLGDTERRFILSTPGPIPDRRLPVEAADRPSRLYLERLYADLGISSSTSR